MSTLALPSPSALDALDSADALFQAAVSAAHRAGRRGADVAELGAALVAAQGLLAEVLTRTLEARQRAPRTLGDRDLPIPLGV